MKKNLLKLGKVLTKVEQKSIIGGGFGSDPIEGPDGPVDPGTPPSGGGLAEYGWGVCIINGKPWPYKCTDVCPNGTDPLCAF